MIVKLLTEHHLKFLSLKGSCRGLSQSTLVKMSNCWKSHASAQFYFLEITGCIGSSVDSDQMDSSSIDISRLGRPGVKIVFIEVQFSFQNGYFLKVFEGHNSLVQAVAFSPNGQYLVSFLTLGMLGNFQCFCLNSADIFQN